MLISCALLLGKYGADGGTVPWVVAVTGVSQVVSVRSDRDGIESEAGEWMGREDGVRE